MSDQIPQILGRCKLKKRLAEGAMGSVYLAEHATLQIPVAVKVLSKRVLDESPDGALRFVREARIAAKLNHPNIVRVYDCGRQGELYYLVMDYIEGESCRERLTRNGRYDWREAVRIVRAVAQGLKSAAEEGVIHRDIKPDNIMIDARGVPRLTDLGVAKVTLASAASSSVTTSMVGTPYYISPEQARDARNVDLRSDIYSLGATLYHLVCAVPPFDGRNMYEVVNRHMRDPLPSPRARVPELPESLCDVIAKTMAKRPEDRYQSYDELISELTRVLSGEPVEAHGAERQLRRMAVLPAADLADLRGGRALSPLHVRPTAVGTAAGLLGYVSLLGFALAGLTLFQALAVSVHSLAALVFGGVVGGAYVAHVLLRLRPVGELLKDDEEDVARSRFRGIARMLTEPLGMSEPAVYVVRGAATECSSAGLVRKWVICIPQGVLAGLDPSDMEGTAMLAREVGRFYHGHSTVLTLLSAPQAVFSCLVKPIDALCGVAAASSSAPRRLAAAAGALVCVAGLGALAALVLRVWLWAGVAATGFIVFGLLARNARRYSEHAADTFAAALMANSEPLKMLVAAQALASPRGNARLLQEAGAEAPGQGAGRDARPTAPPPALVKQVVAHFSENEWRGGLAARACELFVGRAAPARRLNALAGLPKSLPAWPKRLRRALALYGGLLGAEDAHRRGFLPEPERVGPSAALGLMAGAVTAVGSALVFRNGAGGHLSLVLMECILAATVGWAAGRQLLRERGTREELSVSLLVAALLITLSYMLVSAGAAAGKEAALLAQVPIVLALAVAAASGGAMLALRLRRRKAAGSD